MAKEVKQEVNRMQLTTGFINYVMDKLSSIGYIKNRAMFGAYGIFHEGLMFAIILEDILYFQMDESNHAMYEEAESRPFQHGISYWEEPVKILKDMNRLGKRAKISIYIANRKAIKKR